VIAIPGDTGAQFVHNGLELGDRVAAVHLGQQIVIGDLKRQMDVLAHLVQAADCVDQVVRKVAGVGRSEADARQPSYRGDPIQQVTEWDAPLRHVLSVGVHRLAQQGHLARAAARQPLDLLKDLGRRAASLAAPCIRHDAEGAELVAAVHDGHMRLQLRRALDVSQRHVRHDGAFAGRQIEGRKRGNVLPLEPGLLLQRLPHRTPGLADLRDHPRQRRDIAGADHQVDVRSAPSYLLALHLRHAAAHSDDHPRPVALKLLELAQLAPDLLLRFGPHGAGVQQDDVGARGGMRLMIAKLLHIEAHLFGVLFIHLAAPRHDMISKAGSFYRRLVLGQHFRHRFDPQNRGCCA